MPAINPQTWSTEVIESVRAALEAAIFSTSGKVFAPPVVVVDDVPSFVNVADVLKLPAGVMCGISAGIVQEDRGTNDLEASLERLPLDIIIRFNRRRPAGSGEQSAVQTLAAYTEYVKQIVMSDRSRGGRCGLIYWNGIIINGTEVRGNTRMLTKTPNQSFFTGVVPIACGRSISSR